MTDEESEKHYRSGLPGFLGTIDTFISKLEAVILAVGVLLMAANTIANVIGRFVLGESIFFSGEINRILIIMITFAGIGYAARHGRHIRMSAIYDALPVGGRRVLMIVISLFTSLVMFFLLYYSVLYILDLYDKGRILPALGFPIYIIYVWAPLGFLITGIQYLLTAIKNMTSRDVYLSTSVLDGYKDTETEV
ncbi:TRAP transporter small permease [Halomonas nitroreducens]|uniref:TRAP transporter small permease protein n=1 Tax=Halomonas nitroreducens TaxID=447425 RepID=A0A431V6P9_9GAMM|nr:TRAP transporter small permease [Halomonas nitroreducens]RTR05564.1 TRAP transporter small permease [Halomonas nitroreducens]